MSQAESQPGQCGRCGAPLPANAPEGLCPRCVLALNLSTETDIHTEELGPQGTVVVKPPPSPPLPAAELAILFPQLDIIECLGRGGMGAVYKARQPRLDRFVALKILSPEKHGDPRFAERFEREARTLARLQHPNIVAVHDFGEAGGRFYLLMEFVDGLTLRQLLQTRKLSPPEALVIVPRICEALHYAHQQGIVHRDIKPENILIDKQGQVKIADFGIAKLLGPQASTGLTQEQVIGTPHYMAPEQVEKPREVDHRADIYSLGVVFYEMLTGELPLGKFPPPSAKVRMDVRLDEVVLRSLEKEPERRYQQVSEVKTRVETIAGSSSSEPADQPAPSMKRMAQAFGLLLLAAALLVGGVHWFRSLAPDDRAGAGRRALDRPLSAPPFLAHFPGGSIELVALAPHPSTNQTAWRPDGRPYLEPFVDVGGVASASGRIVREIMFRIRTRDREASFPAFESADQKVISGMGASLIPAYTNSFQTLIQKVHCLPDAQHADFKIGITDGPWETAVVLKLVIINYFSDGTIGKGGNVTTGEWHAGAACVVARDESMHASLLYTKKEGWESKMVAILTNGQASEVRGRIDGTADLSHVTVAYNPDEARKIVEFRLLRRPYHWVEFRNVSLVPGHQTSVTVVDAEKEQISPSLSDLAFGPVFERTIEVCAPPAFRWFDLDTDSYFEAGGDLDAESVDDAVVHAWRRQTGAEVGASLQPEHGLTLFDALVVPVDAEKSNELTPREVLGLLNTARSELPIAFMRSSDNAESTYLFRTREGGAGILKVLGSSETPPGIRVRYQMMQRQTLAPEVDEFRQYTVDRTWAELGDQFDLSTPETAMASVAIRLNGREDAAAVLNRGVLGAKFHPGSVTITMPQQGVDRMRSWKVLEVITYRGDLAGTISLQSSNGVHEIVTAVMGRQGSEWKLLFFERDNLYSTLTKEAAIRQFRQQAPQVWEEFQKMSGNPVESTPDAVLGALIGDVMKEVVGAINSLRNHRGDQAATSPPPMATAVAGTNQNVVSEGVIADLQARYEAANDIMAFTGRDAALALVARDAAAAGLFEFTRKALNNITAFTTRDAAVREASRQFVQLGRRAEALQLSKMITSISERDTMLRELSSE